MRFASRLPIERRKWAQDLMTRHFSITSEDRTGEICAKSLKCAEYRRVQSPPPALSSASSIRISDRAIAAAVAVFFDCRAYHRGATTRHALGCLERYWLSTAFRAL